MALTDFGKFIRKLRIEKEELLKEMADKLGVTSSYLSSVEIGKRKFPEKWFQLLIEAYNLEGDVIDELQQAINRSKKIIEINIDKMNNQDKDLALMLARKLESLDDKSRNVLLDFLEDGE